MSPEFSSDIIVYTSKVAKEISSISVTASATNENAALMINGVSVESGVATEPILLEVGENVISVIVTAEDGVTTKEYSVIVTRLAAL